MTDYSRGHCAAAAENSTVINSRAATAIALTGHRYRPRAAAIEYSIVIYSRAVTAIVMTGHNHRLRAGVA